ncbi:MAG: NAD(P)/FAD-dependent oxidoreductase [Promethearchaeota archaeon]
MTEYDIIVVGAGPAGSLAARKVAEKGLKVLLIEEHKTIGLPVHCSGWLNGCPYTEKLVNEFGRDKIITKVDRWRVWTPKGEFAYEMKFNGGYFVDRVKFDQFLAQKAVQAGSQISIGTNVIDIIREDEKIIGVVVKKKGKIQKIYSDLLIGCDGSKSIPMGIAQKSGILKYDKKKERKYYPGIQVEFLNMKDVEPGVIEIFFGSIFDKHLGNAFVSNLDEAGHAMIGFGTYQDYLNVKKNHPILKKRLENAQEFGLRGGLYALLLGEALKTGVLSGLMLCGDAVGYHGIIHAAISGHMAANIAVDAVGASSFSMETLQEYDKIRRKHPIAKTKLGMSFANIPEDTLNTFIKEHGEEFNKELFRDLEKFDYQSDKKQSRS